MYLLVQTFPSKHPDFPIRIFLGVGCLVILALPICTQSKLSFSKVKWGARIFGEIFQFWGVFCSRFSSVILPLLARWVWSDNFFWGGGIGGFLHKIFHCPVWTDFGCPPHLQRKFPLSIRRGVGPEIRVSYDPELGLSGSIPAKARPRIRPGGGVWLTGTVEDVVVGRGSGPNPPPPEGACVLRTFGSDRTKICF